MKNQSIPNPPGSEIDVGNSLHELRRKSGLSIRQLAEKSGLNVNTLSMIENGKTSLSVSTLQQVAAALQVPVTALFEVKTTAHPIVFLKAGNSPTADFAHGALTNLGLGFSQSGFSPIMVTLEPNADSGKSLIVHTGIEFVFCLEGDLEYRIEDQVFSMKTGDSLLFEAHLPHRWRNPGDTPSRSLLILCPTDEHEHPGERHFKIK